jgi:hypothetical protein
MSGSGEMRTQNQIFIRPAPTTTGATRTKRQRSFAYIYLIIVSPWRNHHSPTIFLILLDHLFGQKIKLSTQRNYLYFERASCLPYQYISHQRNKGKGISVENGISILCNKEEINDLDKHHGGEEMF